MLVRFGAAIATLEVRMLTSGRIGSYAFAISHFYIQAAIDEVVGSFVLVVVHTVGVMQCTQTERDVLVYL